MILPVSILRTVETNSCKIEFPIKCRFSKRSSAQALNRKKNLSPEFYTLQLRNRHGISHTHN
uniref:Uncharacterized protein n=1 Tax=Arundo donax TaxID=35708 RepID=A0A0A8ZFG4_ARUDO